MKISRLLIPLALFVFTVSACSKSDDNENSGQSPGDQSQMQESENTADSSSSEESEHFLSAQQRAMEKAKGVEDMLQQTEEKRRKDAQ